MNEYETYLTKNKGWYSLMVEFYSHTSILSDIHVQISCDRQIIDTIFHCNCTIYLLESVYWVRRGTDLLILCCRNKTGILGWRSEKTETVNGYEAKVEHRLHRQLTDLSHCPEKPLLSEHNLIFPESPLHLKSFISRMNHSQSYFKTFALDFWGHNPTRTVETTYTDHSCPGQIDYYK